jgi:hypothetical protein
MVSRADLEVAHAGSVAETVIGGRSGRGLRRTPHGLPGAAATGAEGVHDAPHQADRRCTQRGQMPPRLGEMTLLAYHRGMSVRMSMPCT